jgi:hypothetical protein
VCVMCYLVNCGKTMDAHVFIHPMFILCRHICSRETGKNTVCHTPLECSQKHTKTIVAHNHLFFPNISECHKSSLFESGVVDGDFWVSGIRRQ